MKKKNKKISSREKKRAYFLAIKRNDLSKHNRVEKMFQQTRFYDQHQKNTFRTLLTKYYTSNKYYILTLFVYSLLILFM